ncbi:EAL and HDOD domain-containing protein [Pseudodesulfovibrio tunisiensis]|uniref:EAL and HDOD domain-containing protein n=1 Tax=Pseudodesulfovibrio tunisiensis TaxID=463192 RepID=UPI001FB32ED9|nr:HDOD domain-containing protein [Pseudodesulfovibrio tunisiensis]
MHWTRDFPVFHGYYYKEPVPRADRTITSAEITRLKLFEIIERQEPDFDALAKAVETDVSISYRLLNFLNSAHFSFAANITSIRQAVVLAGWNPIRNWLRLIILTDMAPSRKNQELTLLSAVRAKLFESSAMNYGHAVDEADKLFMLGLFSLLDAMLDMDMAAIVEHLPIDDQCKQALCRKRNEYSTWLDLASAIENSEWPLMNEAAGRLGISPGAVAVSYQQAFSWANTFFGAIPASS